MHAPKSLLHGLTSQTGVKQVLHEEEPEEEDEDWEDEE
jgi:hypothetical protein